MNDIREQILERLPIIAATITGIAATGRNILDVPGLYRPCLIIQDGVEETILERPNSIRRFSQVQIVELTPDIRLLLRADSGPDAGNLASIYRNRIFVAFTTDTVLQGLVGVNGSIIYKGLSIPEPTPETKEPRVDFTFSFTYPVKLTDLT